MSVQFVCQRSVGGLFVFLFLICAGTPKGGWALSSRAATICRTTICSSEDVASTQDVGMRFRSVVNMSLVDNLK